MARRFRSARSASTRGKIAAAAVAATAAVGALVASSATGIPFPTPFNGWSGQSFQTIFNSHSGNVGATSKTYTTPDDGSLVVDAAHGVLAHDTGGPLQLTDYSQPKHGSLTLGSDGAFVYHPYAGFTGTDTFTYTVSNAVHLYTDHLPSLGTYGGVEINAGGYGSSVYPDPGHPGYFYGLEDRGPNVDGPDGNPDPMLLPIPSYDPSIGLFHLVGNDAVLVRKIPLTGPQGQPFSGLIPPSRDTSDEGTADDLTGNQLANDPNGYDSEGLVALPDGGFWVSDEYGPFVTHFDQWGHELQQLSPLNGTLPAELQYRVANKGMEGLTITPDGKELVGIMQSALNQPDLATIAGAPKATKLVPTRIVTYNLRTHDEHEYLYLLHEPSLYSGAISEIAALSDTTFLVDERDGCFPGNPGLNPPTPEAPDPTAAACSSYTSGAFKQLFKVDIAGATDIGPDASPSAIEHAASTYDTAHSVADPVTSVSYNGGSPAGHYPTDAHGNPTGTTGGGLLIDGNSIEKLVTPSYKKNDPEETSKTLTVLEENGIAPATESPFLDLNGLIGSVTPATAPNTSPTYDFYSHDKVEGVAVLDRGQEVVVSNDSDFGISEAEPDGAGGWRLVAKTSPVTGQQDNGEYLAIDMDRVDATTNSDGTGTSAAAPGSVSQKTVTITVTPAPAGS